MKRPRKFSKQFLRDWYFYSENCDRFTFCGSAIPIPAFAKDGVSAKVAFWQIDSLGKHEPTRQPLALRRAMLVKASVNWHIKQWAEGRRGGTFPGIEWRPYLNRITAPGWVDKAVERQRWAA